MLICTQCKKTFYKESKFCSNCGAPLTDLPEDAATDERYRNTGTGGTEGYGNPPSSNMGSFGQNEALVQTAGSSANPEMGANSAGYNAALQPGAAGKIGAGAIAGMFIVSCVPILGFPAAFLWAQAKMKRLKGKLAAFTAAFVVLNIAATLLAYTLAINLMKNSLEKAVENAMIENHPMSGIQKLPGTQGADPSAHTPYTGIEDNIPVQDIPGMDVGMLEQLIPGFSGMQGEEGYAPGNDQHPEGAAMPETDEDGNMHIDADGDGVVDMIIDSEGSILSSSAQTPSVDSSGTKLPETDEDGNMYLDTDGDGEYDSYMDGSGVIIPMDERTKTDEKGNRYIDYEGDGIFEVMLDSKGVVHYDLDGDGKYESTFEQSWGEG